MEKYEIQEEKIEDEVEKRTPPASKRKARFSKFVVRTLAVFFALFIALWGLAQYMQWRGVKNVEKTAELLEQIQKEDLERAMADTFGGETPQETLRMYIEAVEARDYELASRYVIEGNRSKTLDELRISEEDTTTQYLGFLKNAEVSPGSTPDNGQLTMRASTDLGPYFYIGFKKYPNGVWKIVKI